jgi:methylated-DNA-[protein]-cysteine S-methyltransferase
MKFDERVWELCRKIPKGKITTYKEIANALNMNSYRAVGNALKRNPHAPIVPCHRVVKSDNSVGGYQGKKSSDKKIGMLKSEGIEIKDGKVVDFKKRSQKFLD